jgi:hypothetical protein
MPLIPDAEAQDILTRLGQLETILQGMAKSSDFSPQLAEILAEVQTLQTSADALQTRLIDLKTRFEDLSTRVAALE